MRIGCGCVKLGSASSSTTQRRQIEVVREAIELGVTVFDTADAYGSGSSERVLGRAIRDRRDQVVVSTKGGYVFRPRSALEQTARRSAAGIVDRVRALRSPGGEGATDPPGRSGYDAQEFTPRHLRSSLEASLRRLGTDHVDVYQLHGPRSVDDGLLEALTDLRDSGKVLAFGVGAESVEVASDWVRVPGVDVVQLPFGLLDPEGEALVFGGAVAAGVKVWARGVLGGGLLGRAQTDAASTTAHPKHAAIAGLQQIAAEAGIGLDELAVRWARRRAAIDTLLVGMSSAPHLRRNVDLFDRPPLDDDLALAVDTILRETLALGKGPQ